MSARSSTGSALTVAVTPVLMRYRASDIERMREAVPGAHIVEVAADGSAAAPLDDAQVLLRGAISTDTYDRLIARMPRLRWVHTVYAGVENVLTPLARERGLQITNARGVYSRPIAEYVVTMILAVCRHLPQLLELQHERTWQPLEAVEMRDVTVGVVGLGSIGRATAALAGALGCRVVALRRQLDLALEAAPSVIDADEQPGVPLRIDRLYAPDELASLMEESDFVVLCLPLTPSTENLLDEAMLRHARPGAWVVNIARGRLVDEHALVRALREGRLGGAVLDAFRDEPLPPDSPLYRLPNVIVTPHTSWTSARVHARSLELFCDNLGRFARGEPLRNVVDPAAGY